MQDWLFEVGHTIPEQDLGFGTGTLQADPDWLTPSTTNSTTLPGVVVTYSGSFGLGAGGWAGFVDGWDGYDTSTYTDTTSDPSPLHEIAHKGEDCATSAIRDEINGLATNNTAEHAAAVYKTADGLYHATPVFNGSNGQAPVTDLIMWLIANDVDFSQLTSLYHNHDSAGGAHMPMRLP